MISLGAVKIGAKIVYRGAPHEIIEARHLQMGRGGAKLITKLRNLTNSSVLEATFQGDEKVEEAQVDYQAAQFLYCDQQDQCFVMVRDSYEQKEISLEPKKRQFLKEGSDLDLAIWNNKVIGIRQPKKIALVISYTEPAIKGNTVNTAMKTAQLETGATIQVPLFINTGDSILINSETGNYDSRV